MRFAKAALLVMGMLSFAPAAWAKIDTVRMQDFQFVPQVLQIKRGDIVVWKSIVQCCDTHTTTRTSGPDTWHSPVPLNGTFQRVFNQTGTFTYFCTPHQGLGMTGSIVVLESAPSLGWVGLVLLLASFASAGAWLLQRRRGKNAERA